ncbi:unnamed protein product, partial [Ascophyllum nodosum]
SLDVPAGVTQEKGHTGFLIHLPSAGRDPYPVYYAFGGLFQRGPSWHGKAELCSGGWLGEGRTKRRMAESMATQL